MSPISGEEKSCLDHIWHNLRRSNCNSSVVRPAISDHFAVSIFFDIIVSSGPMRINFRDFSCRNIENFENNLQNLFDNYNLPQVDANECAEHIDKFLRKALNKHFPIKSKLVTVKRLNSPWHTTDIIRCIDKKYAWYKMHKIGQISLYSYKKYCYALRELLRMAEEDYQVYRLQSLDKDSRRSLKVSNIMLGRKVNAISNFFVINGQDIHDPNIIAN